MDGGLAFFDEAEDEGLGEFHHAGEIGVGLVDLDHGEFWVVGGVDAFVAEVAIDFEDAFDAADEEAFEVEFGADAHEEVEVEGVVVRDEGAGGGAAGDGLHHGSFDFNEVAVGEEGADGGDDLRAEEEGVHRFGVGEEIDVTLAIAEFGIGEAVEFVRRGQEGLGEEAEGARPDGDFAGFGVADLAFEPGDVGEFEEFGFGPGGAAAVGVDEGAFGEADLEVAGAVADFDEDEFSGVAEEDDASGDFRGFAAIVRGDIHALVEGTCGGEGHEAIGALAEGVDAEGFPFFEPGDAVFELRIFGSGHKCSCIGCRWGGHCNGKWGWR